MGAPEHPYNPKDPKNAPEVVVSEEEDYKYFIPTDNASLAPEVAAVDSEKELIDKSMAGLEGKPVRTGSGKREFGLRPRTFWVLLAVIGIVVIGAAIGGGISGAAAIAKAKSKPTNTASSYNIASNTSTSSSAISTSSSIVDPSQPTNGTSIASFSLQVFSGQNYQGNASSIVLDAGITHLPFMVTSYTWNPNQSSCCITFCRNLTITGWRCQQRSNPQLTEGGFDEVFIGCGVDSSEGKGRCD